MKVAILAGGYGSRLTEETEFRPKPMVEIGDKPILWHIMMHYYRYHHREFVIALGYKGNYIKRWARDLVENEGHICVHTGSGRIERKATADIDWAIELVDTGPETLTGGRIKRLGPWLGNETFMLTWGDGISNVDLDKLLAFHRSHGKLATMTAVRPTARYGHLTLDDAQVVGFDEKPQTSEGWINGAFFVLEPDVLDYIDGDNIMFEQEPMSRLAADGQLMAHLHEDFWQCMDTLREKQILQSLWDSGNPPWKTWG